MNITDFIIPVIFLLLSLILGRRNPLFYTIFPLMIYQGPGAFVNPESGISFITEAYRSNDFLFVYLVAVLVFISRKQLISLFTTKIFKIIVVIVVASFVWSYLKNGSLIDVILTGRIILYPIIFFMLLSMLLKSATKNNFISFIKVIFGISFVSSVMFIANSSGAIELFPYKLYSEKMIMDTSIKRDFATMPIMLPILFPLAITLFYKNERFLNHKTILYALILLSLVVFFSYTRSLLFISLLIVGLAFISTVLTRDSNTIILKQAAITAGILGLIYFIISNVFSTERSFFVERITEFTNGGIEDTPNLLLRLNYILLASIRLANEGNLLFGLGFDKFNNIAAIFYGLPDWETDTMWGWYIATIGVVGCAIIVLFFLGCGYKFIRFSLSENNWVYLWTGLTVVFFFLFGLSSNVMLHPMLVAFPFAVNYIEKMALWRIPSELEI